MSPASARSRRSSSRSPAAPSSRHPAAPGAEAIHALLDAAAPALEVIPPRRGLVDLDGAPVELADRVLLFWNPHCGFCTAMLEDLRAWEQDVPDLVLVSTGTEEENRTMGLRAPIVLDPGFTLAPAYGVAGTPSAVQLDPDGRPAAPPAIGAPAVLALAR